MHLNPQFCGVQNGSQTGYDSCPCLRANSFANYNAETPIEIRNGTVEHSPGMDLLGSFEAASNASTVSGSGMNFFRKFVQRRGNGGGGGSGGCKDCESIFRREVLIDRLVSDAAAEYTGFDIDPIRVPIPSLFSIKFVIFFYTVWRPPSVPMFCQVFFWKFWLPIGLHSSCSISPTASGTY